MCLLKKLNKYEELIYHKKFQSFNRSGFIVAEPYGIYKNSKKWNQEIMKCHVKLEVVTLTIALPLQDKQGMIVELFGMMSKLANFTPAYVYSKSLNEYCGQRSLLPIVRLTSYVPFVSLGLMHKLI